ncbi:MAG: 1-acyl-sn-glycerol-3-phosphate acyltransferase [Saprospiraceae bacterium]
MKFSLRHQSTGKLYPYIAQLSYAMYYAMFRKIYIFNRLGVPTDQPVLLAANHPTAFVDPCLLCSYLDPPIYNMTRGDVFRKPLFRKLMESINMFPVYRVRDGYGQRDRNDEVFEYCIGKLKEQRVVTIYVEGEHHLEKRVWPCQKGIARIAFAAFERHRLENLQVIPAGCNYVAGDRPRDEVMINIGLPIFVRDYWDFYQENPTGAIQRLCADIEQALRSICYHVQSEDDDLLAEHLLELDRNTHTDPSFPVVRYDGARFFREKALLDRLNLLSEPEKEHLGGQISQYYQALRKAGLNDDILMSRRLVGPFRWLFLLAGLIPFLVGYISSQPLAVFSRRIADKKVKKREFYTSVMMGAGFIAGIVYYLLLFLIMLLIGNPFWIALGLLLPFLGWFSQFYREKWEEVVHAIKALRHPLRGDLLHVRAAIMEHAIIKNEPAATELAAIKK